MPESDNGITHVVTGNLQLGIDANAVVLKSDGAGGLSVRNALDNAASNITANQANIVSSAVSGVGTVGAATVSAATTGDGRDFVTVLTLTNFVVGAQAAAAAPLGLGNKIFTFPAGSHVYYACYMSVGLSCAGTANTPKIGIGSVVASGAVSVLSGTATFMDYLTQQTAADIAGTATVQSAVATAGALQGISINQAGNVKDVFLNVASTWAADNTGNLLANGRITLSWTKMS